MTSESLACLSDPGGRLAGRRRSGQKGWDCMLEACWYGHRGVFFLPGKNIHPCRWSHGRCLGQTYLGQLDGCASIGSFPGSRRPNPPTCRTIRRRVPHTAPTIQPLFFLFYWSQFQRTHGHFFTFQQVLNEYWSKRDNIIGCYWALWASFYFWQEPLRYLQIYLDSNQYFMFPRTKDNNHWGEANWWVC